MIGQVTIMKRFPLSQNFDTTIRNECISRILPRRIELTLVANSSHSNRKFVRTVKCKMNSMYCVEESIQSDKTKESSAPVFAFWKSTNSCCLHLFHASLYRNGPSSLTADKSTRVRVKLSPRRHSIGEIVTMTNRDDCSFTLTLDLLGLTHSVEYSGASAGVK
jgi:hypothetical protein